MISTASVSAAAQVRIKSVPPPVGGWDAFNALADMPAENAPILDNWFPETDTVTMRRGYAEHATGLGASVETLLTYTPQTGNSELFGCAGGSIFDVTLPGPVGAAEVTGLAANQWEQQQISTAGGHFLTIVNGSDQARQYDGASWTIPGITGPDLTRLAWINQHQRRLFFGERDSLDFWYLPVDSIAGAAVKFPLGAVAKHGGFIQAMGTWTRDAGDGADDVAVFVTSEGEAIVYQGIDPNNAVSWSLVGRFDIGQPIGRRCLQRFGGDLVIITEDGFISVQVQLSRDRSISERTAISQQINRAVNDSARLYAGEFGWQPMVYPRGRMLIFNVPQGGGTYHEYVFNTITGKPCRFTGLDAVCWGLSEDLAYFGKSDGSVYLFDTGTSDNGTIIQADGLQAFNDFGTPRQKAFKKIRPIFQSSGQPAPAIDMYYDYVVRTPTGVPVSTPVNAGRWGSALWGIDRWGSSSQVFKGWRGVRGVGNVAAWRVRVNSNDARPSWVSTDAIFVPSGTAFG